MNGSCGRIGEDRKMKEKLFGKTVRRYEIVVMMADGDENIVFVTEDKDKAIEKLNHLVLDEMYSARLRRVFV